MFIFRIKTNTAPPVFQTQFMEIQHEYSTRFSENSFAENQLVYSQTKFCFITRAKTLK